MNFEAARAGRRRSRARRRHRRVPCHPSDRTSRSKLTPAHQRTPRTFASTEPLVSPSKSANQYSTTASKKPNDLTAQQVTNHQVLLFVSRCTEGYMGQRCEYKDLDGSYLRNINISEARVTVLMFFFYVSSAEREDHAGTCEHRRRSNDGHHLGRHHINHFLHVRPSAQERAEPEVRG